MRPWLLSKNSSTDARPTGARSPAPLKITSCIDSPRSAEAFDSPSTQRTASMTFDFPQPLGPTMPTSCPGVAIVVGSTNDLKPASLICVRRNSGCLRESGSRAGRAEGEPRRFTRIIADCLGLTVPAFAGEPRFQPSSRGGNARLKPPLFDRMARDVGRCAVPAVHRLEYRHLPAAALVRVRTARMEGAAR